MSALRVAFIGAGTMALRQAQALVDAGLPARSIVTVYDRDGAAARSFADRFGAKPVESRRAALQASSHAVIATTASSHAEDAFEALQMRRGVFLEKPLAITVRDAAALTVLAERLGLPLHVGLSERFHPVVRALMAELEDRRAERFVASRCLPTMRARDCSVALNLAVHDVDLALRIFRTPLVCEARSASRDAASFHARYVGTAGELVSVEAAVGAAIPRRTLLVVAGNTTFEADLLAGTLVRRTLGLAQPMPVAVNSGLVTQAESLLALWEGRATQGPASAREAFRGQALVASAERHARARSAQMPENLPPSASFG